MIRCAAAIGFALGVAAIPAVAADHPAAFAILAPGQPPSGDKRLDQRILEAAQRWATRPPGAIPRLHTEGTLPHHGIRDISLKAKEDQPIVLTLALGWRLSGDKKLLDQVARYFDDWAPTYHLSFNPIDETGFDTFALAYDLTRGDLPPATQARMGTFWRAMATGYLDAMDHDARNATNNWQSHRVKLATLAAFETGDAGLIARARAAYRRQIAANLSPDGMPIDFKERDALHYVTYDLDPLLMAALAAERHGEDWHRWQAPGGASLAKALDWFAPYAWGDTKHVEFVHSTVQFDRDRAKAGQGEYAPHEWDRSNAVETYALAALIDPRWRGLDEQLIAATGRQPAAWMRLAASAR